MSILDRSNDQVDDPASTQDIRDRFISSLQSENIETSSSPIHKTPADPQIPNPNPQATNSPLSHNTADMCYGSQEYFTSCRHPGNFHVTDRCRHRRCQARVEEHTIHVPGFCPQCQHTAYTDQPRGYIERPRTGGTRWRSYNEMADHYARKIAAAERRVERAQNDYERSGRAWRQGIELRDAQQEQIDAQRGWERDEGDYRAEETRRDDEMSYESYDG
ncbi:MAG: hypothetical protein M1830_007672, partial [Pleopsidium flavum]